MSATMRRPSVWDRDDMVHRVTMALIARLGDQLRSLGPVWLRADPRRLIWTAAPISVLIVAAPASLLRAAVAVAVAIGVGLALQWQTAVDAHRQRSDAFVEELAGEVALELLSELSVVLVEEISCGRFRPNIEQPILHVAARKADAMRRAQGSRS